MYLDCCWGNAHNVRRYTSVRASFGSTSTSLPDSTESGEERREECAQKGIFVGGGLGDAGKLTVHMDSIEAAIVSGSAASLFESRYPLHQENP